MDRIRVHAIATAFALTLCSFGTYDVTDSILLALGVACFVFLLAFSFIVLIDQTSKSVVNVDNHA